MDAVATKILTVFLADTTAPRYALDLKQETHLSVQALYPALARLERAGWLASYTEPPATVPTGRHARRCYLLTVEGLAAIESAPPDVP